eukprot:g16598.t1
MVIGGDEDESQQQVEEAAKQIAKFISIFGRKIQMKQTMTLFGFRLYRFHTGLNHDALFLSDVRSRVYLAEAVLKQLFRKREDATTREIFEEYMYVTLSKIRHLLAAKLCRDGAEGGSCITEVEVQGTQFQWTDQVNGPLYEYDAIICRSEGSAAAVVRGASTLPSTFKTTLPDGDLCPWHITAYTKYHIAAFEAARRARTSEQKVLILGASKTAVAKSPGDNRGRQYRTWRIKDVGTDYKCEDAFIADGGKTRTGPNDGNYNHYLSIWERMWRRDVLRPEDLEAKAPDPPEVDGTAEEIPDSEREEMSRNPLWDYCAEPWPHRLNRIALGRGFKRLAEVAAKTLDFGRKYWRGVRMEVHTMDDMAHMLMLPKISEVKDREQIDKARESVSFYNEYQARLDLLDASTIVVATDGGADPEASVGSGGGVTWFLSEDPETGVPTPIWASCCGVVSDIPGADPDSFDGEGFALVHHCAEMKRNLPAEALATVKRFVFYVDANGLLQALKAFNDKSNPLVIQIVRSLEDLEEVCAPGVVFEFRWTPGHAGNPFNDFADYMATRGLDHATGDERGRAVYKKILTAPILRRIIRETAIPRGVLPPSVGDKLLEYFTEEDAKAEKTPIRFTTFKPEKKKVKDVVTWDIVEAKARRISEHM